MKYQKSAKRYALLLLILSGFLLFTMHQTGTEALAETVQPSFILPEDDPSINISTFTIPAEYYLLGLIDEETAYVTEMGIPYSIYRYHLLSEEKELLIRTDPRQRRILHAYFTSDWLLWLESATGTAGSDFWWLYALELSSGEILLLDQASFPAMYSHPLYQHVFSNYYPLSRDNFYQVMLVDDDILGDTVILRKAVIKDNATRNVLQTISLGSGERTVIADVASYSNNSDSNNEHQYIGNIRCDGRFICWTLFTGNNSFVYYSDVDNQEKCEIYVYNLRSNKVELIYEASKTVSLLHLEDERLLAVAKPTIKHYAPIDTEMRFLRLNLADKTVEPLNYPYPENIYNYWDATYIQGKRFYAWFGTTSDNLPHCYLYDTRTLRFISLPVEEQLISIASLHGDLFARNYEKKEFIYLTSR